MFLVQSGNKPLPYPLVTQNFNTLWRLHATLYYLIPCTANEDNSNICLDIAIYRWRYWWWWLPLLPILHYAVTAYPLLKFVGIIFVIIGRMNNIIEIVIRSWKRYKRCLSNQKSKGNINLNYWVLCCITYYEYLHAGSCIASVHGKQRPTIQPLEKQMPLAKQHLRCVNSMRSDTRLLP